MISDWLAKEDWKAINDDQFIKIQLIEIETNQPKQGLDTEYGNKSGFSPVR